VAKPVSHTVTRPGRKDGDDEVEIPVAEDLATVPGIPQNPVDVAFYSREHPLETQSIDKSADRQWAWTAQADDLTEFREAQEERMEPLYKAALVSGDVEPTGTPVPGEDLTNDIRRFAREIGFGEVGFTRYDRHYTFKGKKRWAKYQHAICLAVEQDYRKTQTGPDLEAEKARFETYEIQMNMCLELADYVRPRGCHAQVLSPHFGSRSRLMLVTTDAPVTYDKPEDYGIHKFCQKCQVCVNRCPGRAISRDKVWWRGVEKNKLIYDRCRPIFVTYHGCAVCMIVCPIQRYGMKPVMEHYVQTGEVLGKGTENLEGYSMAGKGHFGPGELPQFDRDLFEFPHGREEDWLFQKFKERLNSTGVPDESELVEFATDVKRVLDKGETTVDIA
jgi:NAD-dependent dihydropyrimidine dehydrogenase PreA subunit